jgi:HSP20 family protein
MFFEDDDEDSPLPQWRRKMPFGPWLMPAYQEWVKQMENDLAKFNEQLFRSWQRMRERPLHAESTTNEAAQQLGPIVFGYSIVVGGDGKPKIRQFGDLRYGGASLWPTPTKSREPLFDIVDGEKELKVIVELPGVNREEIDVTISDGRLLVVSAEGHGRSYRKQFWLPVRVDVDDVRTTFINGVLEIVFTKEGTKNQGIRLKIE